MLRREQKLWPCTVVHCDRAGCDAEHVAGPGDGHSLKNDDHEGLHYAGWRGVLSTGAYFCPTHATDADTRLH